ncbi:MAG: 3-methyl-2-oxobutanoate dehydrogenase subunit VorB [Candidatus Sumerlaeales bacterium]|nr:3-methyl-2-oxobutanoate dehydrogenase subunit VorB [Candidatus Sumerlaeales bacterium]
MIRFVKGNEAVVIGALYAGCESYFGYPITPASEIAHLASQYFPPLGRSFVQAECETGSINMVYGAASTGSLSMTASSGPGISLMQEGVSYLASAELPAVIVDVQRSGPGLGNIGPEQGDYNQVLKGGGHGDYRTIVLAPGTVQEMCDFTIKAFELAAKYRNPAYVLTDAVMGQMMEPLLLPEKMMPHPDFSAWKVDGDKENREHLVTSIILEFEGWEKHNFDLEKKYESMAVDAMSEEFLTDDAELILSGYGICSRIARSAVEQLRKAGIKAGLLRPKTLYPFDTKALSRCISGKKDVKILVVELSNGQYRDDLQLHLAKLGENVPIHLTNRMGGNLMTVDEVLAKAKEIL